MKSMQQSTRLYVAITASIVALVILGLAYVAGVTQGQRAVDAVRATAQAEKAALLQMRAQPQPTLTPTPTETATVTATPSPSATPTFTPTPTPGSIREWGDRYQAAALAALNNLTTVEFRSDRARAAIRRAAQDQSLYFVPVSYLELSADPWAAVAVPRTPDGDAFPVLYWQDTQTGNRIRAQSLDQLIPAEADFRALGAGVAAGTLAEDPQGRLHLLLVEGDVQGAGVQAYVLAQPDVAADFVLWWKSADEEDWPPGSAAEFALISESQKLLPDLRLLAPLAPEPEDRVGAIFIETSSFARQIAESVWSYGDGGGEEAGYGLQSVSVLDTPLTTLAQVIKELQRGNVTGANQFANRIDLLQQAYDLGLGDPGIWLGTYLLADGSQATSDEITPALRFFDNADRSRTFEAQFELGDDGRYRLAAIERIAAYTADSLVTAAPPLPTSTPSPTPTAALAALQLPFTDTVPITGNIGGDFASVLVPTNTPEETATSTVTPTPSETPTATPNVTATPTASNTPTATVTPTPTDTATVTPTPSATPLPIPPIPPSQAALVTGQMFVFEPARVRGSPGLDGIVLTSVENEAPVELFGITEAQDWVLIRIPSQNNVLGWMFRDLVFTTGDTSVLPRHRADGSPVDAPTPTSTPQPGTATPTLTPTPRTTPALDRLPAQQATGSQAPGPLEDELALVVNGLEAPADPRALQTVVNGDGKTLLLDIGLAEIEAWGGLFGAPVDGWISAPAELLWPGTRIYALATASADDSSLLQATRVRIAMPPEMERTSLVNLSEIREAVGSGSAMALLGSELSAGVFMLESSGTVKQMWGDEREASWVSGDDGAGIVLQSATRIGGAHLFTWIRLDGTGLTVRAQPFHNLHGATGDAYGGLWWIESPQADLDRWQLWHFDPSADRIRLVVEADGTLLPAAGGVAERAAVPQLLSAIPEFAPGPEGRVALVELIINLNSRATQADNLGVVRLRVQTPEDGDAWVTEPQPLLLAGSYQGLPRISPDRTLLAYLSYNASIPSLGVGQLKPANSLNILDIADARGSRIRTVYTVENEFEFLAPEIEWLTDRGLIVARSRFTDGAPLAFDRFGLVRIDMDAAPSVAVRTRTYLVPDQRAMTDFAACRDGESVLLTVQDGPDLQLMGWDTLRRPQALYQLPDGLDQALICWHP